MKKLFLFLFLIFSKLFSQMPYNFTALSSGYTPISGGTTVHAAGVDEALSATVNIGFTFNYNCTNYTQIKISSNGWITFSLALTGSGFTNNLDFGPEQLVIAPLWDDLQVGTGGAVRTQLSGAAPNRIFTIEWFNMEWNWLASGPGISFQVRLYETTNRIEFIYQQQSGSLNSPSASIGLNGLIGSFLSLNSTGASPAVSSTTETDNLSTKPATGQVYRWDPFVCSSPPAAGIAQANPFYACTNSTINLSVSGGASGCGLSYQWQQSSSPSGPFSNMAGGTNATHTVAMTLPSVLYFRRLTTCAGNTATSSVVGVTLNSTPPTPSCSLSSYTVASVPYNFLTFTGSTYPTTDDVLYSAITFFGFQFCYAGQSFNGSYIASNSSLVFDCFPCFPNITEPLIFPSRICATAGSGTGYTINNPAPTNNDYTPMNAILAPWHDIYPTIGGTIHATTLGTAPNRTFVVCWHDVPMYSCTTLSHTSQVKLFETSQIVEIHVANKPLCATFNNGRAILGLHNHDGTIYVPPVNMTAHNSPTQWTMTNTAYRFTPTCPTISNCATPLPVEFSALYGQQINRINYVWWEVPNPEIIEEFYVERSFDEGIFTRIATVKPQFDFNKYEYKDYDFKRGGFSYYRIVAKLKSGGFTSTSIYPIYSTEDKMLIKSIYPNPAYDKINLDINSYQPHQASFIISDNKGNVIKSINKNIPFGFKTQTLDISDLAAGIYILRIVTPDAVLTEKIIKN
jgi:hypothetical protein